MSTAYSPKYQTFLTQIATKDLSQIGIHVVNHLEAIGTQFHSYVMKQVMEPTTGTFDPIEALPAYARASFGNAITKEMAQAYLDATGIKINTWKRPYAIVLPDGKQVQQFFTLKVSGAPTKGGTHYPLNPALFIAKNERGDGDKPEKYEIVQPLNKKGEFYFMNIPSKTRSWAKKKESKSEGLVVVCESTDYVRNTSGGKGHGTPHVMPSWLSPGQSCDDCPYAPQNTGKGTSVPYADRCINYIETEFLMVGILEDQPTIIGPIAASLHGQFGYSVLKTPLGASVKVPPLVVIAGFYMKQEHNKSPKYLNDTGTIIPLPTESKKSVAQNCEMVASAYRTLQGLQKPPKEVFKEEKETPAVANQEIYDEDTADLE